MNKVFMIAAAVLVLAVSLGAFLMRRPTVDTSDPIPAEVNSIQRGSFRDLLAGGVSQTCTFTDLESNSNGTIYLGNGHMRGDITSRVEEMPVVSHMIIQGGTYMYLWMDNEPGGFKASLEKFQDVPGDSGSAGSVDLDKQVDYECGPWAIDETMFTVPADREFTDLTAMMESAPKATDSMSGESSSQCAACEFLSGEDKTECLQVLSCN